MSDATADVNYNTSEDEEECIEMVNERRVTFNPKIELRVSQPAVDVRSRSRLCRCFEKYGTFFAGLYVVLFTFILIFGIAIYASKDLQVFLGLRSI